LELAMSEFVKTEVVDRVQVIRLHRPEKKNALTRDMYTAITAAMQRADDDDQIRAVLIAGTPDCFTSGNDMADFINEPPTTTDSPVGAFLRRLTDQRKPLVAAVNGPAVGVGVTLLLHCDLAYAGVGAKFHMPFVSLGLCPEAGSSLILPAMIGRARAAELLLLCERFGADKAEAFGIINAALPDAEVYAHALDKARRLAAMPPNAVRTAKQLLKRGSDEAVRETILHEFSFFSKMLQSQEALEAMTAFMQKRAPDFSKFN
jgi:enoyl-CoA hydratase/carnithine racemase